MYHWPPFLDNTVEKYAMLCTEFPSRLDALNSIEKLE